MEILYQLIYRPLYNILIFLYDVVPGADFGIAIILVTIIIKFALIPISKKQIEQQKKMQDIQPKLKEIQEKHKDNKEKQMVETMALYKENKFNPASGCLPLIAQLILFIAFYRILFNITDANLMVNADDLYGFVSNPGEINKMFFGIVDLSQPNVALAVLAALGQFVQTKMMFGKREKEKKEEAKKKKDKDSEKADSLTPNMAEMMNKQMVYLLPLLTLFFGLKFASGLALYWLTSIIFTIVQQKYILKKDDSKEDSK